MSSPLSALVADAASAAHGEARRMAYGMLANSVEAAKEASVQFAADARCVEVCLRGLEAGDEAIRVAAAKCVKAAAKRAPAFRGALAKKGGIAPLVAMAETGSVEAAMRAACVSSCAASRRAVAAEMSPCARCPAKSGMLIPATSPVLSLPSSLRTPARQRRSPRALA